MINLVTHLDQPLLGRRFDTGHLHLPDLRGALDVSAAAGAGPAGDDGDADVCMYQNVECECDQSTPKPQKKS